MVEFLIVRTLCVLRASVVNSFFALLMLTLFSTPLWAGEATKIPQLMAEIDRQVLVLQGEKRQLREEFAAWSRKFVVTPDYILNEQLYQQIKRSCPQGRVLPVQQANDCNARIGNFNALNSRIRTMWDNKKSASEQQIAERDERIRQLGLEKESLKSLADSFALCDQESKPTARDRCRGSLVGPMDEMEKRYGVRDKD